MSSNEYMRNYTRLRYRFRRKLIINYLGNKCIKCKSTKKLEVDHIDRATKTMNPSQLWKVSEKRLWEEIAKCQLLCQDCHIKKTVEERGQKLARGTHGTLSSYRYCKCDICKETQVFYTKKYGMTHKRVYLDGKRVWQKLIPEA